MNTGFSSKADPRLSGENGRRVLRTLGIIAVIAALLIGLFVFAAWPTTPVIEGNVDHVEWLPPEAFDISYYSRERGGWVRIAEGKMAEEDFRGFARSNGWTLEEKKDVSVSMRSVFKNPPLRKVEEGIEMDVIRDALVYED